jgi:hypothetical protein
MTSWVVRTWSPSGRCTSTPNPGSPRRPMATRRRAPGTRCRAAGTRCRAPGSPSRAPGTRCRAPGSPSRVQGSPSQAHDQAGRPMQPPQTLTRRERAGTSGHPACSRSRPHTSRQLAPTPVSTDLRRPPADGAGPPQRRRDPASRAAPRPRRPPGTAPPTRRAWEPGRGNRPVLRRGTSQRCRRPGRRWSRSRLGQRSTARQAGRRWASRPSRTPRRPRTRAGRACSLLGPGPAGSPEMARRIRRRPAGHPA